MNFEDQPIDFGEHQFTLEEVVTVTGVADATIRSWMKRDVASVGKKHVKLGRWLFSGVDCIRLRAMGDMIATTNAPPASVAAIAERVVQRFWEMNSRNASGGLIEKGYRKDTRLMVSFAGGELNYAESTWNGETYTAPVPSRGHWAERFRRPHIIVPCDTIILDVMTALSDLLRKEDNAA